MPCAAPVDIGPNFVTQAAPVSHRVQQPLMIVLRTCVVWPAEACCKTARGSCMQPEKELLCMDWCVCVCHTYALSEAFNKDNWFCLFHCNSLLQHAANASGN